MFRFFAAVATVAFVSVFLGCWEGKKVSSEQARPETPAQKPETPAQKPAPSVPEKQKEQVAVIETDFGKIVFKFYFSDAPKTCENFITLAKRGFYNNLTFHRIVPGFVIQGGCPRGDGTGGPDYYIKAEFNARKHVLGTVAMARSQHPDSAGSQFYICLAGLPQLDGNYTVFGQVIEGIDAVQKIGRVETVPGDRPKSPVYMRKVYIEER